MIAVKLMDVMVWTPLARSTTGFCLKKGPVTVVNKMPTFGLICDECDIFVASPGSGVPRGRFYDSRPSYWPAHWRFSLPNRRGAIPLKAQILATSLPPWSAESWGMGRPTKFRLAKCDLHRRFLYAVEKLFAFLAICLRGITDRVLDIGS
jgi:hypothetical protein